MLDNPLVLVIISLAGGIYIGMFISRARLRMALIGDIFHRPSRSTWRADRPYKVLIYLSPSSRIIKTEPDSLQKLVL